MAWETDLHNTDARLADRFEQVITDATPSTHQEPDTRQGAELAPQQGDTAEASADTTCETLSLTQAQAQADSAAEAGTDEQSQLERYFSQISRIFTNHQQLLAIAKTDNALLSDELRQLKEQYDSRVSKLEQQNRDYIDLITSELDALKGENNRLKNEVSSREVENSLLVKNFQLQEENLEHLKKELAEKSSKELTAQLDELRSAHDQLKEQQEELTAELKATAEERDSLRREVADEEDQKNALISRFRAEIATLEEKHSLQLERQQLEMDRKLLNEASAAATAAEAAPENSADSEAAKTTSSTPFPAANSETPA